MEMIASVPLCEMRSSVNDASCAVDPCQMIDYADGAEGRQRRHGSDDPYPSQYEPPRRAREHLVTRDELFLLASALPSSPRWGCDRWRAEVR